MADMTLITANKNYCNWPLPAWLCFRVAGLEFDEIVIPFGDPDARERFKELTPMGSVPALKHGAMTIWDSLAICEYVAELAPKAALWPDDQTTRAVARLLRIYIRLAAPTRPVLGPPAASCRRTSDSARNRSMCQPTFKYSSIAILIFGVSAARNTRRTDSICSAHFQSPRP